jgi:5-formyltetrahydrofolate cyclo-ligase
MGIENKKDQIRETMKTRRAEFDVDESETSSRRICERIAADVSLRNRDSVLFYYPAPGKGEVDLRPLFEISGNELSNTRCSFPRVNPSSDRLEARLIGFPPTGEEKSFDLDSFFAPGTDPSPLEVGTYGIPEPDPGKCPTENLSDLDLVFVPGLAFDPEGYRVGYGGGYYDRLLDQLSGDCGTMGVCWSFQVIEECPRESHDRAVDVIFTEDGPIR